MDPESTTTARNSNTALLRKLSVLVTDHAQSATFACGGSVDRSMDTGREHHPSVVIRWDGKDDGEVYKTFFPCAAQGTNNDTGIEALVQRCEPATFGQGDRDVLDEGYRKAGKLDQEAFSTGFHPHDWGIVDVVGRVLMPGVVGGGGGGGGGREGEVMGVRAELYKLNVSVLLVFWGGGPDADGRVEVYSAPAGRFLTHVDTPRGLNQFGSLVVGMPCAHEG